MSKSGDITSFGDGTGSKTFDPNSWVIGETLWRYSQPKLKRKTVPFTEQLLTKPSQDHASTKSGFQHLKFFIFSLLVVMTVTAAAYFYMLEELPEPEPVNIPKKKYYRFP